MLKAPFRRVVTGHNAQGEAVFLEDGPPPRVARFGGDDGPTFYEVWNTRETPARIAPIASEPHEAAIVLAPPRGGTRIRVLDFPPESEALRNLSPQAARAHFEELGAANAHTGSATRHPFMHRTETIDYGIILEGEITLILDKEETTVRAGDIVVQRGTNHGWANRSGRNCRVAFILIDGKFEGMDRTD